MEIVGVPALAFAVGVYLPLESTTPVFVGGLVRWLDRPAARQRRRVRRRARASSTARASIAGGSLMGLVYASCSPTASRGSPGSLDLGNVPARCAGAGPLVGLLTFARDRVPALPAGARLRRARRARRRRR